MSIVINYNTVIFVKGLINIPNKSIIDYKTLRNGFYYYKPKTIKVYKTNIVKMNDKSNNECLKCNVKSMTLLHNKVIINLSK
jgi:hypothetical protein